MNAFFSQSHASLQVAATGGPRILQIGGEVLAHNSAWKNDRWRGFGAGRLDPPQFHRIRTEGVATGSTVREKITWQCSLVSFHQIRVVPRAVTHREATRVKTSAKYQGISNSAFRCLTQHVELSKFNKTSESRIGQPLVLRTQKAKSIRKTAQSQARNNTRAKSNFSRKVAGVRSVVTGCAKSHASSRACNPSIPCFVCLSLGTLTQFPRRVKERHSWGGGVSRVPWAGVASE